MHANKVKTYAGDLFPSTAFSQNLDADKVDRWRNAILVSANDTGNMRSVAINIVVDFISVFRLVVRSSAAKVRSPASKEGVRSPNAEGKLARRKLHLNKVERDISLGKRMQSKCKVKYTPQKGFNKERQKKSDIRSRKNGGYTNIS